MADARELVTRCLFRVRRVLHKDISKGNVLFKARRTPSMKPDESLDFCTVLRLLGKRHV